MVKKENIKFKSNSTYITRLIIYIIGIAVFGWLLYRLINSTEHELIQRYSEQELIGGASQKGAKSLQRFLINKFGKEGLIAVPLLVIIGVVYELLKEFGEYNRYLRKSKLFRRGLVSNLDDDYEPVSIFKRVRNIFGSKSKKNPSNKKMRKELRKNKYFK
ncbi:MAG: hypothetical protein ACOCQ4_03665 [bacterium]